MRKIKPIGIIICYILLAFSCQAKSSKVLFWNIKWGSSPEEVKKYLCGEKNCVYKKTAIDFNEVRTDEYEGVFSGKNAWIDIDFIKDHFISAEVTYEDDEKSTANEIEKALTDKYGIPDDKGILIWNIDKDIRIVFCEGLRTSVTYFGPNPYANSTSAETLNIDDF